MTNLQKLRQAIIKEIPEIVELKFGCYFSGEGVSNGLIVRMVRNYSFWFTADYHHKGSGIIQRDFEKKNIEIHGRDITLADILWYLQRKGFLNETKQRKELLPKMFQWWNVTKNDLNLQSERCWTFLAKIILKEDEV